jgi:hypothetical protein
MVFPRILINLFLIKISASVEKDSFGGNIVSQEGELAKKTINIKRQHFG